MDCTRPGFPGLHYLLEFSQTHVLWASDSIQLSNPLSSPSPPAFNLSQHQSFSSKSALHIRWPKYWCFSFSISPSNEYSGLIFFRIDCVQSPCCQRDTVQKHHFFSSQPSSLSNSHTCTWLMEKPVLTVWNFVGKVTSLLFNTLSRFIIAFLSRSKHLLISWLQSLFTMILEPRVINSVYFGTQEHKQ